MVVVDVAGQLVGVRPVDLARGREVVRRVRSKAAALVGVREVEQPRQSRSREPAGRRRRAGVLDRRAVAGEDAAAEEVVGGVVDRELEVAVQESVRDPLVERRRAASTSRTSTTRSTLRRGTQANAPVDDHSRRGRSRRSRAGRAPVLSRLHVMDPRHPTRVNDSTSAIIGFIAVPRPWTFAASAPPIAEPIGAGLLLDDAPLRWRPSCVLGRYSITPGHSMPASTSTPLGVELDDRRIPRVSSSRPPAQNCWPPIAWRPPAIAMLRPSFAARRTLRPGRHRDRSP